MMFQPKTAFSGFSVNDLAKAQAFYTQTLGVHVVEEGVGLRLHLPGLRFPVIDAYEDVIFDTEGEVVNGN